MAADSREQAISRELDRLQSQARLLRYCSVPPQAVLAADSREQAMSRELDRLQSQARLLRLKSQEVEDVSALAERSREEGRRALQEAHQLRDKLTRTQLELERQQARLRAQEKLIQQVRREGLSSLAAASRVVIELARS